MRAFAHFGWEVKRDVLCRGWTWNQKSKLVAVNPAEAGAWGTYDIAIVEDKEGVHFEHESALNFTSVFGKEWGLLKQEYARLSVLDEVESRCGSCESSVLADGTICIEIEIETFA